VKRLSCVSLVAASMLLGGCYGPYGYDEYARYDERKDTITPSAGDAKEVNARTHMETPWPVYVGDRRIPANGDRMARVIGRYRVPPPPAPPPSVTINAGGAAPGGDKAASQ
jgi:hypothetical protein